MSRTEREHNDNLCATQKPPVEDMTTTMRERKISASSCDLLELEALSQIGRERESERKSLLVRHQAGLKN